MLIVGLRDLRFRAQHGVHEEESVLGGEFVVDVECRLKKHPHDLNDTLAKTLNYGSLHAICTEVMQTRAKLIEELAERIATRIWEDHADLVAQLKVEIRKLHPPLTGRVGEAFVRLEEEARR